MNALNDSFSIVTYSALCACILIDLSIIFAHALVTLIIPITTMRLDVVDL